MTDRPASWRMPTPEQMEKMVAPAIGGPVCAARPLGPADDMPPEYWRAVLDQASAAAPPSGDPIQKKRLCDIERHVLRVACRRCGRIVEVQKSDAVRLAGAEAVWKDLGQRLLNDTCQQRTGRHEEDGCWPSFA